MSYRFYDIDKGVSMKYQKPYEEIGSWKRTELQLRDEKAHAFALLLKENPLDLGKLAFDLLAGNLRFVIPDKNQRNKSCSGNVFWEKLNLYNYIWTSSITLFWKPRGGFKKVVYCQW